MPPFQVLPGPRTDPFAYANQEAFERLMQSIARVKQQRAQRELQTGIFSMAAAGVRDPAQFARYIAGEQVVSDTGQTFQLKRPEREGFGGFMQGAIDPFNPFTASDVRGTPAAKEILRGIVKQAFEPYATKQAKAKLNLTEAQTKATEALATKRGTASKDSVAYYTARGYTPKEARAILDIKFGLKPRASSKRGTLEDQLSFWQTIRNKTLDPFGDIIEAEEGDTSAEDTYKLATEMIKDIRRQIQQRQGGVKPTAGQSKFNPKDPLGWR